MEIKEKRREFASIMFTNIHVPIRNSRYVAFNFVNRLN